MAEIAEGGGGGHDKGKKRAKKASTKVDMTPMVDLAFLLLTFFVLTSTFSKPKVMSLVYPAKPKPNEVIPPAKVNNGITFLISEDKIYYYQGQFYTAGNPDGKPATELKETNFGPSGLRKLLADLNSTVLKNKEGLDKQLHSKQIQDTTYERMLNEFKGSKEALKVLIKTDDKATCKNFIDLVDELKIAQIGVIAPVDLLKSEQDLMKAKQ
ncbi:MAG: biopolymer transporter ExbD [Crocinitomicaceae bacterium]|jgi:biopolymer transport protein ExbD|nr:biopolymer transporter ExbD [Crocinitomicaceae bacterium]